MTQRQTNTRPESAMRNNAFRQYFYAICFGTLAIWTTRFLIGWIAWELTQSAFWVGTISAALLLPTIFLSPIFGVLSDRINPKNGMVVTSSANMTICLTVAALSSFNLLTIIALLFAAIAFGCVTAAQAPMRLATLPRLVNREQIANAIGISAIIFNISRILGPAFSAALLTFIESKSVFAIAAVLFIFTALILIRVNLNDPHEKIQNKSILKDLMDGFDFVGKHTKIKLVLLLTLINGLVVRTLLELLPALSGELTGGGAKELAILTACAGAGSILGGVVVSRQNGRAARLIRLVFIALIISQALLLPLLWISGLWALAPIIALSSMMMTVAGTSCQALMQLSIEPKYVGRVMGIWMVIAMGSSAVGAFIVGALADWIGIQTVIFIFALTALVITARLTKHRHDW